MLRTIMIAGTAVATLGLAACADPMLAAAPAPQPQVIVQQPVPQPQMQPMVIERQDTVVQDRRF